MIVGGGLGCLSTNVAVFRVKLNSANSRAHALARSLTHLYIIISIYTLLHPYLLTLLTIKSFLVVDIITNHIIYNTHICTLILYIFMLLLSLYKKVYIYKCLSLKLYSINVFHFI
jgi:hypothetical protein